MPWFRLLPIASALVGCGLACLPAAAGEQAAVRQASDPVLPPCTCRAAGRVFDMGQSACLDTPGGPRLAICAMDQNVSSWRFTAQACPSASLRPVRSGPG